MFSYPEDLDISYRNGAVIICSHRKDVRSINIAEIKRRFPEQPKFVFEAQTTLNDNLIHTESHEFHKQVRKLTGQNNNLLDFVWTIGIDVKFSLFKEEFANYPT